jgi:hypothetical protein
MLSTYRNVITSLRRGNVLIFNVFNVYQHDTRAIPAVQAEKYREEVGRTNIHFV